MEQVLPNLPFVGLLHFVFGSGRPAPVELATAEQSGNVYTVRVSNAAGSVTSSPATLTVNPELPFILWDPDDQLVAVGDNATFEVLAVGDGVLTYQWFRNGGAVTGVGFHPSYTVYGAAKDDHGDVYTVVVSNAGGSTESYEALLEVNEAPVINSITLNGDAVTSITIPVTGAVAVDADVADDGVPDWGLGLWYEWWQNTGEGWMFADDPWAKATNLYFSEGGEYEIELYVDDWHLAADPVTADVTVVEFGEIEFDRYSLPVGGSVTASLAFVKPSGRSVEWSIKNDPAGSDLGCSINSSGVITPGSQTGTITVQAKDSELGTDYVVEAEIDVISLDSFTVLDGTRGITADETNSVTASSETIETLLVKKGSGAAVIKMEVGVSPGGVIPVDVCWTITGGSASPAAGNFGGLRPYALLNAAGSYDVKAGCDTNNNGALDESEVTRSIRVMAVQFTNTAPGNICQNDNDNAGGTEENKGNGTRDQDESGFTYDDQDIKSFSFGMANAPDYGTLTLSVTTDVLEVWTDARKSSQPASLSWDLSGQTPPSTLYLEGTAISTSANVTLTYTWAGQSVSQVRKLVVLGEGFDSQLVAGCDLYLIPYVDDKPHFGPVCKDQRVTFKVVDCRTEEEPTDPPEPPAPTTCPTGLTNAYRIKGYSDGTLSACEDCQAGGGSAWDGTFRNNGTTPCYWADEGGDIDGMMTYVHELQLAGGKWQISITCLGPDYWPLTVWQGEKTTGETPVGGYNRTGGCDTTGSLAIEEVLSCPTDRSGCPDTLTVTIGGPHSGYCDPVCTCEEMTGEFVVNKSAGSYHYIGTKVGVPGSVPYCIIQCGVTSWILRVGCDGIAYAWEAPFTSDCPPTDASAWAVSSFYSAGCSGGTVASIVAGSGGSGGSSGGGPDPAHENNAVVTELVVLGGTDESGNNEAKTVTASTPGENQITALATVEWNGETHSKTAQLTVVEITGIEYSENGGDWVRLDKEAPADGDIVALAGDELTLGIQAKYQPDNLTSGELSAVIGWELNNQPAGYITASWGPATSFVYDSRTPYVSRHVADTVIDEVGCASVRGLATTFATCYTDTAVVLSENSVEDENLCLGGEMVGITPKLGNEGVKNWVLNRSGLIEQKKVAEDIFGKIQANLYDVAYRGRIYSAVEGEPTKVRKVDDKLIFSGVQVSFAKKYNQNLPYSGPPEVHGQFGVIYWAKNNAVTGNYYLVPSADAKADIGTEIELTKLDKSKRVFGGKAYLHVYVCRLTISECKRDAKGAYAPNTNRDDLQSYLPGCRLVRPGVYLPMLWDRVKAGNKKTDAQLLWGSPSRAFAPQLLCLYLSPVPDGATRLRFRIADTTAIPGYCENAGGGKDDRTADFSFTRVGDKEVFEVDGEPLLKGQPYAPLWCKDYGGACRVSVEVEKDGKVITGKGIGEDADVDFSLNTTVPLDSDRDRIADCWEMQQISDAAEFFRARGGIVPPGPLDPNWGEVDEKGEPAIRIYHLPPDVDAEPPDWEGLANRDSWPLVLPVRLWPKTAPHNSALRATFSNNLLVGKTLIPKLLNPIPVSGDGIPLFAEYRGYILDGGGFGGNRALPHRGGHVRLTAYTNEVLTEVDAMSRAVRKDDRWTPGIRSKRYKPWEPRVALELQPRVTQVRTWLDSVCRRNAQGFGSGDGGGSGLVHYYVFDQLDIKVSQRDLDAAHKRGMARPVPWSSIIEYQFGVTSTMQNTNMGRRGTYTINFDDWGKERKAAIGPQFRHVWLADSDRDDDNERVAVPSDMGRTNSTGVTMVLLDAIDFTCNPEKPLYYLHQSFDGQVVGNLTHEMHHPHVLGAASDDGAGHFTDTNGNGFLDYDDYENVLWNYNFVTPLRMIFWDYQLAKDFDPGAGSMKLAPPDDDRTFFIWPKCGRIAIRVVGEEKKMIELITYTDLRVNPDGSATLTIPAGNAEKGVVAGQLFTNLKGEKLPRRKYRTVGTEVRLWMHHSHERKFGARVVAKTSVFIGGQ